MPCGGVVGVESVGGAWGVQRRQSRAVVETASPPPLTSRRLESAADAATAATSASFNSVVATTQRCAAAKGAVADVAASRLPRIYAGPPLVVETRKEDAMEPEAKEEDERRSSTPSPEVTFPYDCYFFFSCICVYANLCVYVRQIV